MVDPVTAGAGAFAILFGFFWLLFILVWVVAFIAMFIGIIVWIVMLLDVVQRKFPKENDQLMWLLIVVLAGIIGAIIYYVFIVSKDKKGKGPLAQKKK